MLENALKYDAIDFERAAVEEKSLGEISSWLHRCEFLPLAEEKGGAKRQLAKC